jgi:hypothetical protein
MSDQLEARHEKRVCKGCDGPARHIVGGFPARHSNLVNVHVHVVRAAICHLHKQLASRCIAYAVNCCLDVKRALETLTRSASDEFVQFVWRQLDHILAFWVRIATCVIDIDQLAPML